MDSLLNISQVAEALSTSKCSIYRLVRSGDLPKPVRVGPRLARWRSSEIQDWMERRERCNAANYA